jgi:xanthine dehydrogenase accessory factor
VVVREALKALRDGQPRFISLVGEGGAGPGRREGVLEYPMPCHSGGTMEIYVEPVLPKPQLVLIGRGPVVETLARLGDVMGFAVLQTPEGRFPELGALARTFIVVATHGSADEDALEQALRSRALYVSLVASRKRAGAVVDALRRRGMPTDRLGRLKAPAGLDIQAVTPEEIAVSILAEIIQVSRSQKMEWTPGAQDDVGATEARDPVCGMPVEIASAEHRSEVSGRPFYFCCLRCKQTFDRAPEAYIQGVAPAP